VIVGTFPLRFVPPWARAIAMIAAASMTHESGFHMKPRNLRILLSCKAFIDEPSRDYQSQVVEDMNELLLIWRKG
jgi:hypothetical protein